MKRIIKQSVRTSRRVASFANFKESKRVRWSQFRHFVL